MGRESVLSPLAVAKTAKKLMDAGLISGEPVWYQPVINTPPMTDLSRKAAQSHRHRPWSRPNDIREIQQIQQGIELKFRTRFYKEHPWELARPRIVVEEDGADYARQDWSRMEQSAKKLDGERYISIVYVDVVLCSGRCI
jgi:small subunit ribosomal protein S23